MNEQQKPIHFCPNCGSELTSVTSFCPYCGGKIVPETETTTKTSSEEIPAETKTASEEIHAETKTVSEEIPADGNVGMAQQPQKQSQPLNRTTPSIKQFILKYKIPVALTASVALILIIVIAVVVGSQTCIKGENFAFSESKFVNMVNSKTDIYIDPESYNAYGTDDLISGYSATFNEEDGDIYLYREGLSDIKMIGVDFSSHTREGINVTAKIGSEIDSHFSEKDAFYQLSNGESYSGGKLTAYCTDNGYVLAPTELLERLGWL